MKRMMTWSMLVCGGLLGACATVPPQELVDARAAYQRASTGLAGRLKPDEVHKAHEALAQAEQSYANAPESYQTRDLAYVAERKAQMAEALAAIASDEQAKRQSTDEYLATEGQIVEHQKSALDQSRVRLAQAERVGALTAEQLAAERQARIDADKRASEALASLGAIKNQQSQMVITLNGSVLFAFNEATLLPSAQSRLDEVASALLMTKDRNLIVEGYTDSFGSDSYNLDLSQRRAESVRNYIAQRGYPADRITARGMGKENPIADNSSPEGRANNRRVEIVVSPASAPTAGN